jgi:hypothetical protein
MYACSPQWPADWITVSRLERSLPQLAKVIQPSPEGRHALSLNHGLHFSGGEPFLNFELLLKAVALSEKLEIPSTFVETNGFWCKNNDVTRQRLVALKEAGLKGILISVNPYYAEFVPFERTDRCVRIGLEIFGSNLMVYQLEFYRLFKRLGITGRLSSDGYTALIRGQALSDQVELFLMGRAADRLKESYSAYPAKRFMKIPCRPDFIRSWHNHFDNYGNFMPGYCGGISLGRWFELDRILINGLDLENKPVLNYLINEDMAGLFHFAMDKGYREPTGGYVSKCHLCLDIRKYLVSLEDFEELQPRQFYDQLR